VPEVPPLVRNKAFAAGDGQWLAGLPELVAGLAQEWSLALGRVFDDATEALFIEAALGGGTTAVLKILVPGRHDAAWHEATTGEPTCLTGSRSFTGMNGRSSRWWSPPSRKPFGLWDSRRQPAMTSVITPATAAGFSSCGRWAMLGRS